MNLIDAFYEQSSLIEILFSGAQASILPMRIEEGIKQYLFAKYPDMKDNVMYQVLLTYQVQGCFYAWRQNAPRFGLDKVLEVIDKISGQFAEMMQGQA